MTVGMKMWLIWSKLSPFKIWQSNLVIDVLWVNQFQVRNSSSCNSGLKRKKPRSHCSTLDYSVFVSCSICDNLGNVVRTTLCSCNIAISTGIHNQDKGELYTGVHKITSIISKWENQALRWQQLKGWGEFLLEQALPLRLVIMISLNSALSPLLYLLPISDIMYRGHVIEARSY